MTTSDITAQRTLAMIIHHLKASPRLAWADNDARALTNSALMVTLQSAIMALDKGDVEGARKRILEAVNTLEALAKQDVARRQRDLGHD